MKEILPDVERWLEDGEKVVVATVVATRRSAPRPVGAISGGVRVGEPCAAPCRAAAWRATSSRTPRRCSRTGEPRMVSYGISDDQAWSVGLPCGGEIDVFLERVE